MCDGGYTEAKATIREAEEGADNSLKSITAQLFSDLSGNLPYWISPQSPTFDGRCEQSPMLGVVSSLIVRRWRRESMAPPGCIWGDLLSYPCLPLCRRARARSDWAGIGRSRETIARDGSSLWLVPSGWCLRSRAPALTASLQRS